MEGNLFRQKSEARAELDANELSIRPAVEADGEAMADIAALVNIHNYADFDRGFLFYSLSGDEYANRIRNGHQAFVLVYRGELIGFICGVASELLRTIVANNGFVYSSVYAATDRLARDLGIGHYVMLDQIAVLPQYQNRGAGEHLFAHACRVQRGPFFGDMMEFPLRNPRIAYWCKRGFEKIGEVSERPPERFTTLEGEQTEYSKLTWGIYYLRTNGFRPAFSKLASWFFALTGAFA